MGNYKYPWEKWFSRTRFTIKKGKHYDCMTHAMAVQVRSAATRFGVSVSIAVGEDMLKVKVE